MPISRLNSMDAVVASDSLPIYSSANGEDRRISLTTLTEYLESVLDIPDGGGDVAADAIWDAAGDLVYGTGANTAARLPIGSVGQALVVNGSGLPAWTSLPGGGDALIANPLSQFASTTSAQLRTVISDETGSGSLVFNTSPSLVSPAFSGTFTGTYTLGGSPTFPGALGQLHGLVDPNADRIYFWDDSAGSLAFLELGTNLSITGTVLNAAGGGGGPLSDGDYGDIVVSGTGTAMAFDTGVVTSFARTLLDDADAAAMRATLGVGTGSGDASTNTSSSVDNELVLFSGTSGKTLKRATGTGVPELLSGVVSVVATTGSGSYVKATSPTLVTPALGTPSAVTLTNGTGLPIATGVSGLGTGVATFLATPSSANLRAAITDESGSGALLFAGGALGTPASGALSNCTDLPISTGVSGMGSGIATFLATPSSANLAAAITNETGSGALVFGTSPTLATPTLSGIVTRDGAEVLTANAMGALVVDTTKVVNTKSISADSTFTFSGAPATAQTWFQLIVTNTDTAPHQLTMPSCFNMATGTTAAHVVVIQASGKLHLTFRYDGSAYNLYGDGGYLNKFDATAAPGVGDDIADGYGPGSLLLNATGNTAYICESNSAGAAVWHQLGGGTVTATAGALSNNAVVLGAGTTDTKVSASMTTDGAGVLNLGTSGSVTGAVSFRNGTSGTLTLRTPTNGAMGSAVLQLPIATDTLLGRDTTDTVTNKTISAANNTLTVTQGKHLIPVMAGGMAPSATGGCAALATVASAANQPDIVSLDFDATTEEYAQFSIPMPESWNEGTLTFQPVWSHPATTTNFGVVWSLQAVAVSDDDPIAVAYGTAVTSTDTGGTTNDVYVGPESSAMTVAGTPANKDMLFFRIFRTPGNGSDTMAVDARLHGVRLYFTTNAETDA